LVRALIPIPSVPNLLMVSILYLWGKYSICRAFVVVSDPMHGRWTIKTYFST
jgi:hypothetical protein